MKKIILISTFIFSFSAFTAVPTEEGLLKNLNNANIPGNMITIKAMAQNQGSLEGEAVKSNFFKFVISLENSNTIGLLQVEYSNGQMLNSQIKDVKYIPDLLGFIRREKNPEQGLFYSVLSMLATNKSQGMEILLEKAGAQIVKNKNILNEEKMRLLRSYRSYLVTNKGKGDASSPLNPADPALKAKTIELFRANTFERSRNIELIKIDNEFFWKADWKSIKGYFSNEERRLSAIEYNLGDGALRLEAKEYVLFNGTNELPKFLTFKDTKGVVTKLQILGLDTKINKEKKLNERYDEARKLLAAPSLNSEYSFIY